MSRHRNIRNRAYSYDDEEYDEDYYDDEPYSPGSQAHIYRRDPPTRTPSVFSFMEKPKEELAFDDSELVNPIVEQIKRTLDVGHIPHETLVEKIRLNNYDMDKTVIGLMELKKQTTSLTAVANLPKKIVIPRLETLVLDEPKAAKAPAPAPRKIVEAQPVGAPQSAAGYQLTPLERAAFEKAEKASQDKCLNAMAADTDAKQKISMVVIGHVDAGKSTITGHLLFSLGYVSKQVMHKYEKQSREAGKSSFAFAWVMDADEEERLRGVTMDVGTTYFQTTTKHVTLLDAPGHRDFIPKMIAGASQADVAVLVVPASTGEFEGAFMKDGQTKEHTLLVRSLGVTQMIVAVNKMDSVNWSKDRFDFIVETLSGFLQQSGFKLEQLRFVPVSGLTGGNLLTKLPPTDCPWYTGPTLVGAIDGFYPPQRPITKPFRMGISDISKSMSLGQTVSGRIYTGAVSTGDMLLLMPGGLRLSVKGMEQNGGSITMASAGDNVDLGITGIDPSALSVGNILCSIVAPIKLVRRFEAQIMTMPAVEVPLVKGAYMTFHIHSIDEPVNITRLVSILKKSGEVEKKKPRCITRNCSAVVQITCQRPICLELFADFRQLGRFTLRDRGSTLAAGIVTDILA
ncbi:translation elongation factor 1-alpha [Thraustotheca clavata]|uniref:Translation elongation factor 1-alpha n=1 Tax=Thraustotheca clavata TaxID=74557 RepID=A0A1V9ZCK8_9STRA|nr:translation elongation factor 1-alpha [Thraustotheca clavata]